MIKRVGRWIEDRTGIAATVGPLLRHPVPPNTDWGYALGTTTLMSFLVLVVTGIALATGYTAATNDAYHSINWISHGAILGWQVRGIHYFAASAMIISIGLHALYVYLMGSYKFPREVNWLSGVVLLLLTLVMAFTGQLLRWDQNAVWSVVVAAEQAGRTPFIGDGLARFILGGDTVSGTTLTRFFAIHVFIIPGLIFLMIGAHLYLVIRNGISEPPTPGRPVDPKTYRAWYRDLLKQRGVPFWPDAAWRDVVSCTVVVGIIVAMALLVGPPELGKPPDPTIIQASPAPDWYFLWYFAALAVLPAQLENWVIIGGPLLLILFLIGLPFFANKGERSPLRRPWAVGISLFIVIIIGTLLFASRESPWVPNLQATPLPASVIGSNSPTVQSGAALMLSKGCLYCHIIGGDGGSRGPNLSNIASRYTQEQMTIRILNGATNMPAFGRILTPRELSEIEAFLLTRK